MFHVEQIYRVYLDVSRETTKNTPTVVGVFFENFFKEFKKRVAI